MTAILPPKSDEVFKMLFGNEQNKEILAGFLKAVLPLPDDDYEEIEILNPFLPGEALNDKIGILDLKLRLKSGRLIDVEIQVANHAAFRERVLYYLTRLFTSQIGEGDSYRKLKPAIGIIITDFLWIADSPDYHTDYLFCSRKNGSVFSDYLTIHTLELPKVGEVDDKSDLWAWLEFLKAKDKEELEMLAKEHPAVEPAVKKLLSLSENTQAWIAHEAREKARRDELSRKEEAEEKGWERGLKKGREEGREEALLATARRLLGLGMPVEEIARITELSQETIRALVH
ncbi:MAG: Rpn family recombination-promoting nuclease/putative transposase [Zoogloeaceae bacterium]|jgi:predicted transposase/invertase (TIGR01784 family)|nr:Rpn family recombination-promoting nuclease/putative transposase [Zoogloeaceae bacterium]